MRLAERWDALDSAIEEGRVIRNQWTEGHDKACLLATISPEVRSSELARDCPAELMSAAFAHLTPWIDDAPSEAHWPEVILRYARLARRWHVLDDEAWQRCDWRWRIAALDEAKRHTEDARVRASIESVRTLLIRALAGDAPSEAEWAAAPRAAAAAAETAAWAAETAAWAAAWEAAKEEAADRIVDEILEIIEQEVKKAEAQQAEGGD